MNTQGSNQATTKSNNKAVIALIITIIVQGVALAWTFSNGNSVFFDVTTLIFIMAVAFVISVIASLAFLTYLSYSQKNKIITGFFFIGMLILNYFSFLAGTQYLHYTERLAVKKAAEIAPQAVSVEEKLTDQILILDPNSDVLSFNVKHDDKETKKYFTYDRQNKLFNEIPIIQNTVVFSPTKTKIALDNNKNSFGVYESGTNRYWEVTKTTDNIIGFGPVTFSLDGNFLIIKLYGTPRIKASLTSQQDNPDNPYGAVQETIGYSVLNLDDNSIEFVKETNQQSLVERFWPNLENCTISNIGHLYLNHIDNDINNCSISYKNESSKINIPNVIQYENKYYQAGVRTDISNLFGWHSSKEWYYVILQAGGNADAPEAIFRISADNTQGVMVLNTVDKLGVGKTDRMIVLPNNDVVFNYYQQSPSNSNLYILNEKNGLKKLDVSFTMNEPKIIWEGQSPAPDDNILPSNAQNIIPTTDQPVIKSPYDSQ